MTFYKSGENSASSPKLIRTTPYFAYNFRAFTGPLKLPSTLSPLH